MNRTVKNLTLRLSLFALILFCATTLSAQDTVAPIQYDMTFKGRGEATKVTTVKVENLSQNTELNLEGDKILRLTNTPGSTDVKDITYEKTVKAVLFPNPSFGNGFLTFANKVPGTVTVSIYDMLGRSLISSGFTLTAGQHTAILPAMPTGTYIVAVRGSGVSESMKWTSTGSSTGGAISMENAVSPLEETIMVKAVSEVCSTNEDVVEMLYQQGDLLRFTGKNGNMTTIVMNQPTCSHDITFDFYACTDASGKHYAIVNVGGMLWMAEDLGMVSQGISIVNDATTWTDTYTANDAKAAYYGFDNSNSTQGAYYNYEGATVALPEGWDLPTQGEVDYMINKLGGYTVAADKLKSRENNAWSVQATGLDTVSFFGVAGGELSAQGVFSGKGSLMRYWTRSTTNKKPNYWGVQSKIAQNVANGQVVESPAFTGLRVRGCRPAPSAYSDVMDMFPKPKSRKLFETGPIGGMYTVVMEKQKLFHGVYNTAQNNNPVVTRGDYNTSSKVFDFNSIGNNTAYQNKLQKVAVQNNSSGRQNLVLALWGRGMNITPIAGSSTIDGSGLVSLVIYGDSTQNYARIDSISLPTLYNMPLSPYSWDNLVNKSISSSMQEVMIPYEWYAKRINVVCADFNQDGIDDFVVMVGNRIDIYNGVSPYALLESKTFTNNNLRFAVGDVDNDGNPDIAVVYPLNNDNAQVEVFPNGQLSNAAAYSAAVPAGNNNDIKIGEVTGNGKSDIVCYTRQDFNTAVSYLRVLEYDENVSGSLSQIASYSMDNVGTNSVGTGNIVLCKFRGANYPADIVIRYHTLRYNTGTFELKRQYGSNFASTDCPIYADQIVAGNFNGDEQGKEQVYFLRNNLSFGYPYLLQYTSVYKFDGTSSATVVSTSSGYNRITAGIHLGNNSSVMTAITNNTTYGINFPFIAGARSEEPAKVLKFKGHKTTMSEPRIYALLAAPPFYKYKPDGTPYQYNDFASMGTSWGKSQVSGSGSSTESSYSVSAIFGFNIEFNAPIVGTKLGEIDFTTKLESEWTNSTEKQYTTTQSIEFTAPQDDAVVLSATFFDTYTYEVIQSGNPDDIGGLLTISLPGEQRTMGMTLNDYERLTADNPTVPNLRQLFKHKVGFPFTYPSAKNQIQTNVSGSSVLWAMPFAGQEFVSVGSGTDVNRSITLDEETVQTSAFSFGMEMELVATVGTVKAGAGFGYNNTNASSHTEGKGHSIAGHVSGLQSIGDSGLADYRWTVCWYKYKLGGQTFPVIQYVVQP